MSREKFSLTTIRGTRLSAGVAVEVELVMDELAGGVGGAELQLVYRLL
jgi:hypothetical protein